MAGPYRIEGPLGAGAMGEVYRARDTRLQRDVALKLLAASAGANADLPRRFEQEARTVAALHHPNLLAIYDVGVLAGAPFLVTELLQGESLRQKLAAGPLPARKAAALGAQIAQGLAAAHAQGIVHRDLKPENVFITSDEHARILDFGLAKLNSLAPVSASVSDDAATLVSSASGATTPGIVLGTVGYMAPEQARGEPADARSDIFSLGAVLYEMVSGRRAFQAASGIETLSAIVRDDPPPLAASGRDLPPMLVGIIERCLEKQPSRRFQNAGDLAFALELLDGGTSTSGIAALPPVPAAAKATPRTRWRDVVVAAAVAAAVAWWVTARLHRRLPPPAFAQITFQPGTVSNARFEPGDAGIVYSAQWESGKDQIYERRRGDAQARPVGISGILAAISPQGELAVIQNCSNRNGVCAGTLALANLSGGTPRARTSNVVEAAFAPGGAIAVIRQLGGESTLEFPPGHVLARTQGWFSSLRFSPDGRTLAFLAHPRENADSGSVETLTAAGGQPKVLASGFQALEGLAWAPDGSHVLVAGAHQNGFADAIYSIALSGHEQVLLRLPGYIQLMDLDADGSALVTRVDNRTQMLGKFPGNSKETDLSWQGANYVAAITPDGREIAFCECGATGGRDGSAFIRSTDGKPPLRLGDGVPMALSPDGSWLAVGLVNFDQPEGGHLALLPTGVGSAVQLPSGPLRDYSFLGSFLPDGKALIIAARTSTSAPYRLYRQDVPAGIPQAISGPITPAGPLPVTADGRAVLAKSAPDGQWYLYPVAGGSPSAFRLVPAGFMPLRFSSNGKQLYEANLAKFPYITYAVDLASGRQTPVVTIAPTVQSGNLSINGPVVSSNGLYYAYAISHSTSTLYRVTGLH